MSQIVTEPSGQVITVYRGWTGRKKLQNQPPLTLQTRQKIPKRADAASSSTSSDEVFPKRALTKSSKRATVPRHFEFVHGTGPFRNRDPEVRKLVRAQAMRDSARRKKQRENIKHDQENCVEDLFPLLASLKEVESKKSLPWLPDTTDSRAFRWKPQGPPSFAIDLDPFMSGLVHDLSTVSSRMYPRESIFKFNPVSPAHWFHFALEDKALFHAVMYTVSMYSTLLKGATQSEYTTMELVQCIGLVNERIAGNTVTIANGTIGAVACLALVEVVAGNYDGWNVHMNGVKRMVEMRGGIPDLPHVLQLKIYRADVAGAMDFIAKPHFLFLRSERLSIYAALSLPGLSDENDDLTVLLRSYSLNEKLLAIMKNVTRFSRAIDFGLNRGPFNLDSLAFVEDTYQIQFGLLPFSESELCETDEEYLEEALRMGALIYMKETLQEYPLAAIGSTNLVRRLKKAISSLSNHKRFTPLVVWLMFIGGIASKKSLDRVWFMANLIKLVPRYATWDDMKRVLGRILWIERIYEVPCRDLWREVEITRNVNSTFMSHSKMEIDFL